MPDTDADTDVTAAASARPAAEAVRELNHRTHPANSYFGPEYPADVYDVLGALHVGTQRLPQPVGQLGQFPEREAEAGRVAAPSGVFAGDVPAAAATAGERLDRAAALARQLTQALRNAQLAVSGLAYAGATTTRTAGEPVRGRPGGVLNVRNGRDVRRLAGHPPGVRPHPGHAERAGRLLGWLDAGAASVEGDPLADSDAFTPAARDRWAYLLTVAKAAPATVDVSLAALVALGECLGLGPPDVARVDQPARASRAGPASAATLCGPAAGTGGDRPPELAQGGVRGRDRLGLRPQGALLGHPQHRPGRLPGV